MSSNPYYWLRDLEKFAASVKNIRYVPRYEGEPITGNSFSTFGVRSRFGDLFAEDINYILANAAAPPHGKDLFTASPPPKLPYIPTQPHNIRRPDAEIRPDAVRSWARILPMTTRSPNPETASDKLRKDEITKAFAMFDECKRVYETLSKSLEAAQTESQIQLNRQLDQCILSSDCLDAVSLALKYSDHAHALALSLRRPIITKYDPHLKALFIQIEIPDFADLRIIKRSKSLIISEVAKRERNTYLEKMLYSLIIRACYLGSQSDIAGCVEIIAVNAHQSWRDKNTGKQKSGIVASIQAKKQKILELEISHVDAKSCFRSLKGICTPNLEDISVVRPIFEFNTDDNRIIEAKNLSDLPQEINLASMDWEDFEHLVRQLFEWEFGGDGAEVKITRSSRDRGVDAIMFDPDPIRGGKYIIQAKRYNFTVGVDSVRDLYGTVINEGANRGILVTTSSYGPDSYEFAKGKPISLIDGQHLIKIFEKHGQHYTIGLRK